jgi:hypothetical protein
MARKPVGRVSQHIRKDGTAKEGFESFKRAEKHRDRLFRVYRAGKSMAIYRCELCRKFHVGRSGSRW